MIRILAAALLALLPAAAQAAEDHPRYGAMLEGFDYPHEVQRLALTSQGQDLSMAFMDVAPESPNGRTVLLLHGKNFCAATWQGTIAALTAAGYRVIAPDQIGFCKSSKPRTYQFSFAQLAHNTHALLRSRGVERAIVMGHSMGGMLATRYALLYPGAVEQLVLVNPIGLEDWLAEGVPYATVDQNLEMERKTSFDSIKAYQQKFYYHGEWRPAYDRWVEMLAGMYAGEGKETVAWNQALLTDIVFTQPVVHEFSRVQVPTLLMIGQLDRTAPGANRAKPEVAAKLGDYPALGKKAGETMQNAKLIPFAELGHSPHIEDPDTFHAALVDMLSAQQR